VAGARCCLLLEGVTVVKILPQPATSRQNPRSVGSDDALILHCSPLEASYFGIVHQRGAVVRFGGACKVPRGG
jgi:hypothetical protein